MPEKPSYLTYLVEVRVEHTEGPMVDPRTLAEDLRVLWHNGDLETHNPDRGEPSVYRTDVRAVTPQP